MLLLLPVRQAGSGTKSGLREKNQGLKFLAFPVVLPATSITIASVKKRWLRDVNVIQEEAPYGRNYLCCQENPIKLN